MSGDVTFWATVLIGTATVVLEPTRFHVAMIGMLAFSIGLVFYLIIAMDRPFAGKESISPAPFQSPTRECVPRGR